LAGAADRHQWRHGTPAGILPSTVRSPGVELGQRTGTPITERVAEATMPEVCRRRPRRNDPLNSTSRLRSARSRTAARGDCGDTHADRERHV